MVGRVLQEDWFDDGIYMTSDVDTDDKINQLLAAARTLRESRDLVATTRTERNFYKGGKPSGKSKGKGKWKFRGKGQSMGQKQPGNAHPCVICGSGRGSARTGRSTRRKAKARAWAP